VSTLKVDEIKSVNEVDPVSFPLSPNVNGVDVALENQGVRYADSKAAGTALAASLPDGATVIVDACRNPGALSFATALLDKSPII